MGRYDRKKPANNSFVASTAVEVDNGTDHIQLKHSQFSGKKKKELLNAKRAVKERKRNDLEQDYEAERTRQYEEFHGVQRHLETEPEDQISSSGLSKEILTAQGDLRSIFEKESDRDVEIRKIISRQQYDITAPGNYGVVSDDSLVESIEMPVRPVWSRDETPDELDAKEKAYFKEYIENLQVTFGTNVLNSFELNIEVWRQLWRVIERSDILAVVVDIRLPRLNFPSSLYKLLLSYGKSLVVVLNKVDLVSGEIVHAWKKWFKKEYIGVKIVCMSKHPTVSADADFMSHIIGKKPNKIVVEKTFRTSRPYGESNLLCAIRGELQKATDLGINPEQISFEPTHIFKSDGYTTRAFNPDSNRKLSFDSSSVSHLSAGKISGGKESRNKSRSVSWGDAKVKGDSHDRNHNKDYYDVHNTDDSYSNSDDDSYDGSDNDPDLELEFERQRNGPSSSDSINLSTETVTETLPVDKDGILPQISGERSSFVTIGFIGQPNAGKSSLINALAGRKVVSVSSTPGHTKHLQTIFLNPHTRVCDCPGLVFPSVGAPYPLQVLSGQINIAQVRETYSTLAYVGARYPLERCYALDLSYTMPGKMGCDEGTQRSGWSGFGLAEAHAIKKSYYTSKQRPDTHRAGNEMLRDLQTGRIVFTMSPPDSF